MPAVASTARQAPTLLGRLQCSLSRAASLASPPTWPRWWPHPIPPSPPHATAPAASTPLQVAPLQWPVDVYRRVLDRALSPALLTDDELSAARMAASAEAARLGRPSSFSTRRLLRTFTEGGTEHLELSPILGVPSDGGLSAAAGSDAAPGAPEGPAGGDAGGASAPAAGAAGGAAAASGGASVGAGAETFKELTALDAEFEAILNDLHLILPGAADSDEEGDRVAPAAAGGNRQGSAPPALAPTSRPLDCRAPDRPACM
jgi:hypothetical protein